MNDVTPEMTIAELRRRLSTEHNANLSDGARQPLTLKPNPRGEKEGLPLTATLQSLGLGHGDMVHLHLDESIRDMAHEVRFCCSAVQTAVGGDLRGAVGFMISPPASTWTCDIEATEVVQSEHSVA